ncbi:MAG: 2-octaprenyl-3-methyl-6-methoxy-1,4-benzoquinol hydroxylase [Gammaproteobacteria bacterium]|nr:2-octaprenyl-3-methyl-6-methoxy-1,4-benzoquinol hydroxylase [Gammaproteobacteria bacterium]
MNADIIIVGAGMVGSALALALQDSGLDVLLLDGGPLKPAPFDPQDAFEPRVSALSAASRNLLTNLGAWEGILARRASPYRDMQVWDGSGTGSIHFSASSIQAEVLGHIVENRVVQDALLEQLQDGPIRLQPGARLSMLRRSGDGWLLALEDGTELRTPLLIGADGANSSVRRLAGCATREWDYRHHAVVTSIRTEQPHQLTCWQRFTDEGPLAFLPLAHADGEHWCSIVWSLPPERAQQVMQLDDAAFCTQLTNALEGRLGRVLHADRRFSVPLRQRHAKRYVEPGLALLGDAAHVIHPLAGQGVNIGFLDVAELADALLKAVARGENPASLQVLSRFERKRMPQNLAMMAAVQGFQDLFQSDALPLRWLRNTGLKQVNQLDSAKALFVRQALGVGMQLPPLAQAPLA